METSNIASSNIVNPDGAICSEGESGDDYVRKQLSMARNEISNLRQQLRALSSTHKKDVEKIQSTLDLYKTRNGCTCAAQSHSTSSDKTADSTCRSIGVVSTWFPVKKATPRQPGICIGSHGKLTLSNELFTNPEHALEGLEGFSHMWILFHFHKNNTTHIRAKVSPPRLNGIRTGVFGTRSPNRPSPIGLSLVKIDKVEGPCVYFSGVDMVDGTPVLDIKPYIPQYDNPMHCNALVTSTPPALRCMDGGEEESDIPSATSLPASPSRHQGNIGEREAPDGEEGARSALAVGTSAPAPPQVRVPAWIDQSPVAKLSVVFGDRATAQLDEMDGDVAGLRNAISCVLQEDPRSVYLREKLGNQFFTFLINGLHVSCKFDDAAHTATVFQVKSAGKMCECGQPEWQCTIHGDVN